MKRLLAAVVAIGLIAAGFFVNGRRSDPERGRQPLVLWCVVDAADACNAVASDRVVVSIRTPTEIERDVVAGKPIDAVVTSGPWLDRLDEQRRLAVSASLASAEIVIVTRVASPAECTTATCLLAADRKVALPDPTSLAASVVVVGGLGGEPADSLTSKQLAFVQGGGTPTPGIEPITALVTVRLVDGVVTIAPAVKGVASATLTPFVPPLTLSLKIGTIREDPRIDGLTKELRNRFSDRGWRAGSTDSESTADPNANATIAAYGILNP